MQCPTARRRRGPEWLVVAPCCAKIRSVACGARRIAGRKLAERCHEERVDMTTMSGGRGIENGSTAPALAPGDMDGDCRAMTRPGLPGAWVRRLRSAAFRAGSSGIGGDRSAARQRRDCSGRPGSPGCASAAGRGIAGTLDGVGRLRRAVVPVFAATEKCG